MGKKKDFDLDKIDKLLSQFPDEDDQQASPKPQQPKPALRSGHPQQGGEPKAPARSLGKRAQLAAWIRVAAGVVLALAITQWPYGNSCGLGLFLYLVAIAGVLAVGVWAAIHTWRTQLSGPHITALGVVLWGLALASSQLLPRVGYAKTEAAWLCRLAPAETAPPAVPASTQPTAAEGTAVVTDSTAADSVAPTDSLVSTDSVVPTDSLVPDTGGITDSATASDSVPATPPDSGSAQQEVLGH